MSVTEILPAQSFKSLFTFLRHSLQPVRVVFIARVYLSGPVVSTLQRGKIQQTDVIVRFEVLEMVLP